MNLIAITGILLLALAGCAAPVATPPSMLTPNAGWQNAPRAEGIAREALTRWWSGFHDEELACFVEAAFDGNLDIRLAAERVRESRSAATVSASLLWPTLNAAGFDRRNKDLSHIPARPPIANITDAGLSASWEIDLFGGNGALAEGAQQNALAARESERAVRVALAGEIASVLFTQRSLVAQLDTLKASVAVSEEVTRFASERYRKGLTSRLDVDHAVSFSKTLESQVPDLERDIQALSYRLAILAGRIPSGEAPSRKSLPDSLPPLPNLLPSEWLVARPDLRAARHRVEAANANAASARAAFFPNFVLSAGIARDTLTFQGLPALSGNLFALGLGIVQPIFNAGRIAAQVDGAEARRSEAAASYDKTLLSAIEEVENAFVAYASSVTRREDLLIARDAALRARDSAKALFERGLVDYGVYLDAQRVHLAAEQSLIDITARRAIAMVALYRAFGGGIADDNERISAAAPELLLLKAQP